VNLIFSTIKNLNDTFSRPEKNKYSEQYFFTRYTYIRRKY